MAGPSTSDLLDFLVSEFESEHSMHSALPDFTTSSEKLIEQMWRVYSAEFPDGVDREAFTSKITAGPQAT